MTLVRVSQRTVVKPANATRSATFPWGFGQPRSGMPFARKLTRHEKRVQLWQED